MYSTAVAIFLVILVAALQSSEPPERPFPYRIPLDPDGILELSWNISYVQEIIHFQLEVRGLRAGVLFGMSDRGEMENADLIILWTDGNRSYFAVSPLLLRYPAPHARTPLLAVFTQPCPTSHSGSLPAVLVHGVTDPN